MASADDPPPVSAVLYSIAKHVAARCGKENRAFIECKKKDKNPEACLKEGDAVTQCTIDLCVPVDRIPSMSSVLLLRLGSTGEVSWAGNIKFDVQHVTNSSVTFRIGTLSDQCFSM
jgi:hypothetical protein